MFKRLKKLEERSFEISKKAKELEDKITQRNKFIEGQAVKTIIKDEYFKEIIKLTEGNTYNSTEIILRKIKELAQTAIEN